MGGGGRRSAGGWSTCYLGSSFGGRSRRAERNDVGHGKSGGKIEETMVAHFAGSDRVNFCPLRSSCRTLPHFATWMNISIFAFFC